MGGFNALQGMLGILKERQLADQAAIDNSFKNRDLEQQSKRDEDQKHADEERVKVEHKRLDEQKRQFEIQNKVTQAFKAFQIQAEKQKITESILGGTPQVNDTQTPVSQTPEGIKYSPASGQGNTDLTHHSIPVGDETLNIELPSAQTYATRQAELQSIRDKPKYDQAIKRITTQETQDRMTAAMNQISQNQRAQLNIEAANERARLQRATSLRVAQIRSSGDNSLANNGYDEKSISTIHDRLWSGDATEKEILSEFKGKDTTLGGRIIRMYHEAGGGSIDDRQRQALANYGGLAGTIELMDNFLDVAPDVNPAGIFTKLKTGVSGFVERQGETKASQLAKQIKGHSAKLTRDLDGQKGSLSDMDIIMAADANLTDVDKLLTNNTDIRNNLAKRVISRFDADFKNVSEAQRAILYKKAGLDRITPFYDPGRREKGKVPVEIPASKGVQTGYSPAVLELMKKYELPIPK